MTKSQKHYSPTHSPTWIQEMLAHLKTIYRTTRCQILCSMRLQCVSKILTPRRMLKKSSLIAKINRWNNSFQNMYDMLKVKVDRFARKTFFSPKKHLKPFSAARNLGCLTLREAVCQTIGPRSTIRAPLESLGYNSSNKLLGRSVASKGLGSEC